MGSMKCYTPLQRSASLVQTDTDGLTPLHWAALRGNEEACHLLLKSGGLLMLDRPDGSGSSPRNLAWQKRHYLLYLVLWKAQTALWLARGVFGISGDELKTLLLDRDLSAIRHPDDLEESFSSCSCSRSGVA